ncbi:MAG: flagellar filament capping protein FliD [Nitrosomonadales bacterium]|nr:flagellar filament capping protein FliD [Nitrosomonadales bacterium]
MVISANYPLSAAIGAYTSEGQADAVSQSSLVTQQSPLTPITLDPLAALRRIETSTVTQLSSYGRIKSSLADLQDKARALKNISQPPTLSEFKVVVQAFVQSFNSINKTVSDLTSKKGALNTENRPSQALNDIRKAVGGSKGNALSSLKELGISQQADGTFAIDQKQLEKSFKDNPKDALSAISGLASRVTQASDKLLADKGAIGKKVNDLSSRISELEDAHNTVQGYLDTQQESRQSPVTQPVGGYTARNAIAAYTSVASFQ